MQKHWNMYQIKMEMCTEKFPKEKTRKTEFFLLYIFHSKIKDEKGTP